MRTVLVVLLLGGAQSRLPTFPNIGFVGQAYDIVLGNPDPDGVVDPGFKTRSVLSVKYSGGTTSDGRYSLPDGIDGERVDGCSMSSKQSHVTGQESMSKAFSETVKVAIGYNELFFKVKFSGSALYQYYSNQVYKHSSTYFSSHALCMLYVASLAPIFDLETSFATFIDRLPMTIDTNNPTDMYFELLSYYGTHFTTQVNMGSRYVRRSEFTAESYAKMGWDKIDVKLAAKVEYMLYTGRASSETTQHKQWAQAFAQARSSLYESSLGSKPPTNGDLNKWEQQSIQNPYPVSYQLTPLYILISPEFIPNGNATQLRVKQANLITAMKLWCRNVGHGCADALPDQPPTDVQQVSNNIFGTQTVSCPYAQSAIGCGFITKMDSTRKFSTQWAAFPNSASTCQCTNNVQQATCLALCAPSKYVKNLVRVSKLVDPSGTVSCPKGTQVMSCSLQMKGNTMNAEARPISSTACYCSDPGGVYCHATCASNIKKHTIVNNYGTDPTVSCRDPDSVVLGCGLHVMPGHSEHWPLYYASNYNECKAHGHGGVTVYAVCGSFITNGLESVHLNATVKTAR